MIESISNIVSIVLYFYAFYFLSNRETIGVDICWYKDTLGSGVHYLLSYASCKL